jgi:phospholipase/carboxylesterase
MQDAIVVEPKKEAKYTVIWMHGLGADGHDFEAMVPELKVDSLNVRFIFPNAPVRPITLNGGMPMRGWYDIKNLTSLDREIDENGVNEAVKRIHAIVDDQILAGIPSKNIVLAGFSQGGVIAVISALQENHQLAGVLGLSCYLPNWEYFKKQKKSANDTTSFQLAHGTVDPVVPFKAGELLFETLRKENLSVDFKSYNMQHQVCLEEIKMIREWLFEVLN